MRSRRLISGSRTRARFVCSHSDGSLPVTCLSFPASRGPALPPAPRPPVLLPRLNGRPRAFRAGAGQGAAVAGERRGLHTGRPTVRLPVDSVGFSRRTKLVPGHDFARNLWPLLHADVRLGHRPPDAARGVPGGALGRGGAARRRAGLGRGAGPPQYTRGERVAAGQPQRRPPGWQPDSDTPAHGWTQSRGSGQRGHSRRGRPCQAAPRRGAQDAPCGDELTLSSRTASSCLCLGRAPPN